MRRPVPRLPGSGTAVATVKRSRDGEASATPMGGTGSPTARAAGSPTLSGSVAPASRLRGRWTQSSVPGTGTPESSGPFRTCTTRERRRIRPPHGAVPHQRVRLRQRSDSPGRRRDVGRGFRISARQPEPRPRAYPPDASDLSRVPPPLAACRSGSAPEPRWGRARPVPKSKPPPHGPFPTSSRAARFAGDATSYLGRSASLTWAVGPPYAGPKPYPGRGRIACRSDRRPP